MKIELIETARGFEIRTEEEKFGRIIEREFGESDGAYKIRAEQEFDFYVKNHREFKERIFKNNVIKTANI